MTASACRIQKLISFTCRRQFWGMLIVFGVFFSASAQASVPFSSPYPEMERIFLQACGKLDKEHWACERFADDKCDDIKQWQNNTRHCSTRFQRASYSQMYALLHKSCVVRLRTAPGKACPTPSDGPHSYLTGLNHCKEFSDLMERQSEKPTILNVSHLTRRWQPSSLSAQNKPLDEDPDGSVSAGARIREDFAIQIEQTNPLLFASSAKSIADSDIASLESLKSLVAAAGRIASGEISAVGPSAALLSEEPEIVSVDQDKCLRSDELKASIKAEERVRKKATEIAKIATYVLKVGVDIQEFVRKTEEGLGGSAYTPASQTDMIGECKETPSELLDTLQRSVIELMSEHKLEPHISQMGKACESYVESLKQNRKASLELANGVLGQKDNLLSALGSIEAFEQRLVDATFKPMTLSPTPCDIGHTILLPDAIDPPGWLKKRKIAVSVAKDAALAKSVVSSRADSLESSVTVQHKFWEYVDFAVAVTKTDIDSPKFRALGDGGDPEMFQIAPAGFDSLDGNLALLMDWRAFGQLCESRCTPDQYRIANLFGLQMGPTLVDGDAGFLAGVSVGNKHVRLGYGWAWQPVSRLDGQRLGDAVSGMDAIRTSNKRVEGEYISLSVTFGTLSLFTK